MAIISQTTGLDQVYGTNFDARLERADANTIQLVGVEGTSKRCWVRDIALPIYDALTLDTDSASEFIITGTTTVAKGGALSSLTDNDYNNYGLHYVYLCNNNDCWMFDSYDRRGKLIISAEAPDEEGGYLSSYGDGANCRHVGWVALNSSRQFDSDLCLASMFNPVVPNYRREGSTNSNVSMTVGTEITSENCEIRVIVPKDYLLKIDAIAWARNQSSTGGAFNAKIRANQSDIYTEAEWYHAASGLFYYGYIRPKYSFSSNETQVNFIDLRIVWSSGGAPQHNPAKNYLSVTRFPPTQNNGFTRQFTQEYEAIARTTNGGRLERVDDTTLEWQPYQHGSIGLFNGLNWEVVTPDSNPSAANTTTDLDSTTLTYDTNYDVFLKYESATSASLQFKAWTNDTTRAVSLTRFEGVYVQSDTAEGRKLRWLGTVRLRNDSGAKFTDSSSQRFVMNHYYKIEKILGVQNPHGSDADDTGVGSSWESWYTNGDLYKIEFMADGEQEVMLNARGLRADYNSGGSQGVCSIGIDSKSPITGATIEGVYLSNVAGANASSLLQSLYMDTPVAGYHYAYPLARESAGSALRFVYRLTGGSNDRVLAHFYGNIKC